MAQYRNIFYIISTYLLPNWKWPHLQIDRIKFFLSVKLNFRYKIKPTMLMTPGHCLLLPLLHQSHRLYQMTPAPCSERLLSRPWCLPLWVLCGICPTRVCAYTCMPGFIATLLLYLLQSIKNHVGNSPVAFSQVLFLPSLSDIASLARDPTRLCYWEKNNPETINVLFKPVTAVKFQ